jgi:2-oxoglutarate dehydrogenase E2 component (dihydrolipoamide succinyltransferase)
MDIKVPTVGESVFEALVAKWLKVDGQRVASGESLCELETDKITFEIPAEVDGILRIKVPEGTTVKIGSVIAAIEKAEAGSREPEVAKVQSGAAPDVVAAPEPARHVSPSERRAKREKGGGEANEVPPGGAASLHGKIPLTVRSEEPAPYRVGAGAGVGDRETRSPMTPIRRRIAERLLAARQQTAMLTTINEADMSRVLAMRARHKDDFLKKHGVPLGFMPFFVKACCEALAEFPAVNARIDGDDIVFQHFCDIGIAVSGDKGLVVPVLRNADRLRFAEIERTISDFVDRIKHNRLAISDLEGGTFTITNGGVFGSLMSTPILNPPQSGVLGMHAIQERPVARDGQVVIRPMMYLALSYDHRIIDGREAVLFLKKVKEYIEEPEEMVLEG